MLRLRVRDTDKARLRAAVMVAASLLFHAGVLALLGLRASDPPAARSSPAPTIHLRLEPWPRLANGPPPKTAPGIETDPTSLPPGGGSPIARAAADRTPHPPAVRAAATEPDAPTPVSAPGSAIRSPAMADRVARGLRTGAVGCASMDLISPAEQVVCEDRFARRAALARAIGPAPDPDRDEAFARQAAANEAWRAYTLGEGPYPGLRSLFTQR